MVLLTWLTSFARGVFGGQVVGQALAAAINTVEGHKHLHSIHSYFLRAGQSALPIIYTVTRVRDGTSFATRFVTATQRGKAVFILSASFQVELAF